MLPTWLTELKVTLAECILTSNDSGRQRDPMITLLSDTQNPDGADLTFRTVLRHIREATHSITIHMFVWRNDAIGNEVGQAVFEAAERGVKVHITKDLGAFMFERIEMNRKSFFNKPISIKQTLIYKALQSSFPDTYCEDEFTDALGLKIIAHPKVTLAWVNHTHTKYYIFDDEVMITGSINIEDRYRGYYDYMIKIEGKAHIQRFQTRARMESDYDPQRAMDFILNLKHGRSSTFEIKDHFLRLMDQAESSIYVEMAYIGDPDISEKIAEVANAGVEVTMLFSREANIGNDINYKSMHELYQSCPINAYLTEKMIHSKLMMVDDRIVIMGSANFSVFSMQKAEELNVIIQDERELMDSLRQIIEHRQSESIRVETHEAFAGYNKRVAFLQQLHQKLNDVFN